MPVWIRCLPVYVLKITFCFVLFYFFFSAVLFDQVNRKQYMGTLFIDPTNSTFQSFFIKNGLHSIIRTFKNYFVTIFSVSIFNFSKNKLNTNGFPITLSSSSHSISDLFFLSNNHRDYQYLDGKTPNHQSITHQRSTTHKSELKSHPKKKTTTTHKSTRWDHNHCLTTIVTKPITTN